MEHTINREDMLELTRRMTPKRNCFDRIAGAYFDGEGFLDGTFNTHFLKLSPKDQAKYLAIAKAIPFASTNVNLRQYAFAPEQEKPGSTWQLLMALQDCGLKNDAILDVFYEIFGERYRASTPYAVCFFHGSYDIPDKAKDGEYLGESEEVYSFMICAVCPLQGDYEPGKPESGFLFPAFADRSSDIHSIAVFQADAARPHTELTERILSVGLLSI